MRTIKKTDYVDLSYDEELKIVNVVWLGPCGSDGYRDTWEKAIEFGRSNTTTFLFSNITNQKIVSPIDRKWFEEEILPEGLKIGIKRAGIVFGGGVFKRYYFNNILAKTDKFKLPFKAFSTREEAVAWFKSFE